MITGYDLNAMTLLIDNSWSRSWGMGGRFDMDEAWVDPWRGLARDFWVIERVS